MRDKKLSSTQGRAKARRGYMLKHNLTKSSQQHLGWESPAVWKLCAVCIQMDRGRRTCIAIKIILGNAQKGEQGQQNIPGEDCLLA